MKIEKLKELLLALRLNAMAEILEETLNKAQTDNLSHVDILTLLASQEIIAREQRLVKTRISQAQFPVLKTLDAFDFSFPKSINKSLILNLFDLHFVEEKHNVIIMGPPGTGKTHLALALGYQACLHRSPRSSWDPGTNQRRQLSSKITSINIENTIYSC